MQSVAAGFPVSIEWTLDTQGITSAAVKVYDDSGNTPILVATVPMVNFSGSSYRAKFTPLPYKTYLVNKALYLDPGTWSVPDPDERQGCDSFQAMPLGSSNCMSSNDIEVVVEPDTVEVEIENCEVSIENICP